MPRLGPVHREDLIFFLRRLGFLGPYRGRKHQFKRRHDRTVRLPNPHPGDISTGFLARILRQAGVTRDEWEEL